MKPSESKRPSPGQSPSPTPSTFARARATLSVLTAYRQTRRLAHVDRKTLERYQRDRLHTTLARAREVLPRYREVGGTRLADFPVLTKAQWLESFAGLNVAGLTLAECREAAGRADADRTFDARLDGLSVGLSTGTSGHQGVFLTSPAERARWAGIMLAKALPGGLRRGARVALFLRSGGPLYDAVGGGRVRFAYFDLSRSWEQLMSELVSFAPTVLAAPPVVLDRIAADVTGGGRGSGGLRPQLVYSVADVLDPDVRARVEAALRAPVGQIYQATEGFLGASCRLGTIHLNEDVLFVERDVIDPESGRFVPIVTDLWRTSQAIIRYRLDDILIPSTKPCGCGSVMLAIDRIEGRVDDAVLLPRLELTEEPALQPLYADVVKSAILAVPGLRDFRLVQLSPTQAALSIDPAPGHSEATVFAAARTALSEVCRQRGLRPPDVSGRSWTPEPLVIKARRVRREFAVNPVTNPDQPS